MFQTFKSLSLFPLQLHSLLSLRNVLACPLACFNIPLSGVCTVTYEVNFRPRQLAHIFQYTDFFTYNPGGIILTDGKQLLRR